MIIKYPNSILKQVSEPVLDPTSEYTQSICSQLVEQMYEHNGKGLSAIQIGIPLRIMCIDVDGAALVMMNPDIRTHGELELGKEGCLSFPGRWGQVKRYSIIEAAYTDVNGNPQMFTFTGYNARCIQHEADHLSGVLITDRLGTLSRRMFLEGK